MFRRENWNPSDDQAVQLLVNRGYLDRDQVAFASLYRALSGASSLLTTLIEHGHVTRRDVNRVLLEAREDEQVREKARQYRLLEERVLEEAGHRQRGTRRTLLQTLADERLCSPSVLEALRRPGAPSSRIVPMFPPQRPEPRRAGGAW